MPEYTLQGASQKREEVAKRPEIFGYLLSE
jgi:hypothetical protein